MPIDVSSLMKQAFKRNAKDEENRLALEDAKDVPVIKDVIQMRSTNRLGPSNSSLGHQSSKNLVIDGNG